MSIQPIAILYDKFGNPLGVVDDGGVYRLQAQVTGSGTAGTPATGVITVQGIIGGEPLPITGNITASSSSTSATGAIVPSDATMVGGSDGTNLISLRVTSNGTLRIDPIGTTTQPISVASLPLPSGAATELTLATLLTSSAFTDRINTLGQKVMAASTPVVIASDQSSLSVTGTFWQATQPVSGTVTADAGSGTFAISAAALPLPSGAATETTLSTRLADATFTGRINTLGQKTMANSTPVVLASNQGAIPVNVLSGGGAVNKVAYDIGDTVIYIGTAELGSATSAAVWEIKRITLVAGEPTFTEWSSSTAIWNNRASETYQ